jgi:hypothetical protein
LNDFRKSLGRVVVVVLTISFSACGGTNQREDFLARVGDRYFTRQDLSHAMDSGSVITDSSVLARQLIDQWITTEVLYSEAVRRGLNSDETITEQFEESKRAILTGALVEQIYTEQSVRASDREIQDYYLQHREQLAISEPFVRIRYRSSESADSAASIANILDSLSDSTNPDSVWVSFLNESQGDVNTFFQIAESYYPLGQLGQSIPDVERVLLRARAGEVLPVIEFQGLFHVIQLVDMLEIGTIPDLDMIRRSIEARVAIEARKQMIARQVQRLRNIATASEELEFGPGY